MTQTITQIYTLEWGVYNTYKQCGYKGERLSWRGRRGHTMLELAGYIKNLGFFYITKNGRYKSVSVRRRT